MPEPIPNTTAIWRVMARIVARSSRPMTWPISEKRFVCGQSAITCDASRKPFSGVGVMSTRRLISARTREAIGSTVA